MIKTGTKVYIFPSEGDIRPDQSAIFYEKKEGGGFFFFFFGSIE